MLGKMDDLYYFFKKLNLMQRRSFIKSSSVALVGAGGIKASQFKEDREKIQKTFTLSLNAYSFNKPLLAGEMSVAGLFQAAKKIGFPAVDLTAYYIPGYPEVPEDKVLFGIKRSAFKLGLAISGTGVRNDFALSDPVELANSIELVKKWVVAASTMGAPHVRVFAGRGSENGPSREKVKTQMIDAFQECADFASHYGVMIAFQNHYDYIKTTSDVVEIMEGVNSEWFGLMLDIGSIPGPDPYADIEQLIPYAISWQVKEEVRSENGKLPTDFIRLLKIVSDQHYTGYFPLETLGEGDPHQKVRKLYQDVSQLLG